MIAATIACRFEKAVKARPSVREKDTLLINEDKKNMNNLPLQPLRWHEQQGWFSTKSPLTEYQIAKQSDKYRVLYIKRSDQFAREATGFTTIDEAKAWCWKHYNEKMQPYVKPDPIGAYFDNFTQWANDRQIIQNGDILAQGLKLVSEIGELADNLAKDRCIKDDIGDCMVVLNNLAHMTDTPLADCLAQAWNDIKDRKGTMNEHGVFIKDSDVG